VIYAVAGETRERSAKGEILSEEVVTARRGGDEIDEEAAGTPAFSVERDERERSRERAELAGHWDAGDMDEDDVWVPVDVNDPMTRDDGDDTRTCPTRGLRYLVGRA
jgi:hypothetical protein